LPADAGDSELQAGETMPRRTKIVCTLGPASWSPERIASLIEAGMDVARINFSHGDLDRHAETIRNVREAARRPGGRSPSWATSRVPRSASASSPSRSSCAGAMPSPSRPRASTGRRELPTTYHQLADDLDGGDVVLLADGLMELIVTDVEPPRG
jgi:pyruvate kinase